MAAHLKTGYGRSRGRPKSLPPIPSSPICELCRSLVCGPKGGTSCAAGHQLGNATECPSFKSAAVERVNIGGETGKIVPK